MSSKGKYIRQKSDRRRKAGRPVFGCILALVFGGFSWVMAPFVRQFVEANTVLRFPGEWADWLPNVVLAVLVFLVLYSLGMTVVALATGGAPQDPLDVRTPDSLYKRKRR